MIFEIFCIEFQMTEYHKIHALRPPEHLQTTQEQFRNVWNDFKKIHFFEFSKLILRCFLTVSAYF